MVYISQIVWCGSYNVINLQFNYRYIHSFIKYTEPNNERTMLFSK